MAYIETLNGLNIAPKDAVRAFATVADMQASTDLAVGMTCHTNGFHEEGDGGAAYYTISTEGTANGMDVLACEDGLIASLIVTEPYVTPEQFGAYGDNTHDDAAAINRMLASGYSKNYVLSKIEYLCEANVTISTTDNSFAGRGLFTSGIHFADGVGLVVNNPRNTFADIRFRGGAGVTCNNHHVNFFRCWFYQADTGITLNNGYIDQLVNCHATFNGIGILLENQSYETLLDGCVIDNNAVGVIIAGATSGPVVRDCTIEGNYNRNSGVGCGLFITSVGTRVLVDGCHFEANGSGQDAVDVLLHGSAAETDISAITDEITSLYTGTVREVTGIVSITNNRFTYTKYGIIVNGYRSTVNIAGNYFSGVSGIGNKPVLLNKTDLSQNTVTINDNRAYNTNDASITAEMLSGVKGSYVFTDAVPTTAQMSLLIDGVIVLDGCPLFLYRGRTADLSGTTTYMKLWSNTGASADGGLVNGNITNYYTGATTIYLSTDGTSSNVAVVPEAGYHEFVLVTNSVGARFQTTEIGWRGIAPNKRGVYLINRYTLVNQTMFASNDSVVYALVVLSAADIAKMKQCIAFEPTDLDVHEFR